MAEHGIAITSPSRNATAMPESTTSRSCALAGSGKSSASYSSAFRKHNDPWFAWLRPIWELTPDVSPDGGRSYALRITPFERYLPAAI